MKKTIVIALLVLVLMVGLGVWLALVGNDTRDIKNGSGINPGSADVTYVNATSDNILVELPFPRAIVGPDFTVRGKARGQWFFEASFPVFVLDRSGKELATGIAQAEGDWMTNDFVKFSVDMSVGSAFQGEALLVLKKDNPSGLKENDASVSFPVMIQ